MASSSSSWTSYLASTQRSSPSTSDRPKKVQPRQLLSCTKCRNRKVKCDRTRPCSACCASGHPKECVFLVGEGNDYSPIQQSYEIRKLRDENEELKKEVQRLQHRSFADGGEDDDASPNRAGARGMARMPSTARQKRFKTADKVDNLYFGTPGLASVVSDFANLQVGSHSLTHTMPKGRDFYASDDQPSYPFHVVEGRSSIRALVALLPEPDTLFSCLDSFQRRAQSCSFPHTPDEVTKKEVQRFLESKEKNAELYPDMLALIFATVATGMQMGQYDRSGGRWDKDDIERTRRTSDAFLSASMQSLRLASFMNRPTLLAIQTLLIMGPYLTNSGRFLDAWTLFGTTVRLAHSIGLHRNPRFLDPAPSLRECTVRQSLWWWMLHLDQQYSVTLGRPLGISGYGDCPPPQPLTTNPTVLRLAEFVDQFTVLARQILAADGLVGVGRIDEFTDKLVALWDTMPASLQFNESWLRQDCALPEWPLEMMSATLYAQVQSYLVLLNRQRVERTQSYTHQPSSQSPPSTTHHHHHQAHQQIYPHPQPTQPTQPQTTTPIRGRPLVINSSISLIKVFMFFRYRSPGVLISWALGQQAFNACMILLLDALESASIATDENGSAGNEWLVEQAFVVFRELEANGVHRLAELAVGRLSEGLMWLGQLRAERERRRSRGQDVALGGLQGMTGQSGPSQTTPMLGLDAASMMDWTGEGESVMGQTGMFLLEDHGLQSYHPSAPPAFRPLSWAMAGSGTPTTTTPAGPSSSTSPTPYGTGASPVVPVSQVTAAPFPIMTAPPFVPAGGVAIPVTNSPFAVGLQPRLTGFQQQQQQQQQQQAHAPYQHQHVQQRRQGRAGSGSGSVGTSGQGYGQFFGGFDVGAAFPGEQGMAGLPGPSRQGGMGMASASEMGGQAYGTQHQHQQHPSQQQRRSPSRQQGGRVERIPRSSQRRR